MMKRRSFIETLAALAAARRSDGRQPDDLGGWHDADTDDLTIGDVAPEEVTVSATGSLGEWLLDDAALSERRLEVSYDALNILLSVEASGDTIEAGTLTALTPEQAREIAVALYQAADEHDRRWEETDN